jgi:hypothetical protein
MTDPRKEPYSAALERFTPDAEPFANMTPGRLQEVMDHRLEEHDRTGYWEAELHWAEKTPPFERYIHDLGTSTNCWLLLMEKKGHLPYKGWTMRHMLAVWYMVHQAVRLNWTPRTFPSRTPAESRSIADDAGIILADQICTDPSEIERLQAMLERDHGGPPVDPTPD